MVQPYQPQNLGENIFQSQNPLPQNLPGQQFRNNIQAVSGGGPMQQAMRDRLRANLVTTRQNAQNDVLGSYQQSLFDSNRAGQNLNLAQSQHADDLRIATEHAGLEVKNYWNEKNRQLQLAQQKLQDLRNKMSDNLNQIREDQKFEGGQQAIGGLIQGGADLLSQAIPFLDNKKYEDTIGSEYKRILGQTFPSNPLNFGFGQGIITPTSVDFMPRIGGSLEPDFLRPGFAPWKTVTGGGW